MNSIKGEELYEDDGTIKRLIEELKELQATYKALVGQVQGDAAKIKKALGEQERAGKSNNQAQEEAAKQAEKLSRQYQRYQESLTDTGKEIVRLRSLQAAKNRLTKAEIRLANSAEGSYDKLSAQYSINKIRLNAMSAEMRKSTKEGKQLEKSTKEIFEEMKRLQEATGKTSLNVGNYKESIKEAVSEMSNFPGVAGQVVGGASEIGQSFKALARSPLLLVVGAIVGALGLLFNGFQKSANGSRTLAQAGARLKGALSVIQSEAGKVAESLLKAFENPRKAISDLAEAVKSRLGNALKGVFETGKNLGDFLGAKLTGDTDRATAAFDRLKTSSTQALTGLDGEQQKAAAERIKEVARAMEAAAEANAALEAAQFATAQSNRELARTAEAAATQEARLQIIAGDSTRSFKELEEANAAARKASEQRAGAELRIARNNLALIDQEINLRRGLGENVQDLLDQQLSAFQQVAAAERDLITTRQSNEQERRQIEQDRLERDLDILIDGFDNQKTINEQRIRDEELTFERRRELLDETVRLSDDSFAKQIETIQKFTGVQVDANELIAESDAVALNGKIRALGLSEIIEGRLLEIIRDRKSANQDLASAEADLSRAEIKAANEAAQARIKSAETAKEAAIEQLEVRQALAESEFNLVERSTAEVKKFELAQEAEKLQGILDINREFQENLEKLRTEGIDTAGVELLSEDEKQTIVNQIAGLQREITEASEQGEKKDIFQLLGFEVSDEKKEAISSAFNFAKQQVLELARLRTQLADQALQESNQEVQSAEAALQAELTRNEQGLASNIESRRRDLENAQEVQRKAREEQRRAQRAERRLQTIQQAANLVTASAKIWGQLGFPAALPAIGLMFGSFIATKARAARLARQENRRGTWSILRGGSSHETGRDISLGVDQHGVEQIAERGESFVVVPAAATSQYQDVLPGLFEAINSGKLNKWVDQQGRKGSEAANVVPFAPAYNADNSAMEQGINRIADNTGRRVYQDSEGNTIIEQGLNKTIIRRA